MKVLTFAQLCSLQDRPLDGHDLHIIVESFKEQILCSLEEFPRAYKICILRGKESLVIPAKKFKSARMSPEAFKELYDKGLYK